jgi:citrate synthase
MDTTATVPQMIAPPGLKNLVVADTTIGSVRGGEGFFHYRQYDATDVARRRSFEATAHLLLEGALPDQGQESAFRARLADNRHLATEVAALADRFADDGHSPGATLRALLSVAVDPRPTLDLSPEERRAAVLAAIGAAPTILAAVHRRRAGMAPLAPDAALSHAADFVRMVTGRTPDARHAAAVGTYLSLTADHGFNASTFTARVITSTGADVGGVMAGAVAALSGPLHGGAPSRVLDMLDAIGDPSDTEAWAERELGAGRKIMGFGHAVYRADDPRSTLLRQTAIDLGGPIVERALEIEARMLSFLARWKPEATLVTNVEFYAAVVLHLAGIPQDMFTATFTTSRIVGWGAHVLEQAGDNKIMRPSARYVGPPPPRPVPDGE